MGNYEFDFNEAGPYGSAVRLLSTSAPEGRVVLDVGCGAGAVAGPLGALGATYVGLDLDEESVAALTERGVEAHVLDLTRPDLREALDKVVNGRRVAAVLCLDVLEHVPDPKSVLEVLASLAAEQSDVELVVSVPNVGHVDLARQLLAGRWDMTESGLLDRTHVRFFTERTLTELMVSTGWYEAAREDFVLNRSDQSRAGHPLFEPKSTLGALVDQVRSGADEHGKVNQFVRRYHRGAARVAVAVEEEQPFLTVVMRTQGKRPDTLVDVLCCLGAQTDLDFEVVMVVHDSSMETEVRGVVDQFEGNLAHRVTVVPCDGGTRGRPANAGLAAARGEYVVFLDDDDLVTANWVENIKSGARTSPGTLVRWWAAEQHREWAPNGLLATHTATGPLTPTYATRFDMVKHIRQNETPFHCFAFPRVLVEMGFRFDESLTVCEDWEFLVRAASFCGVHDTEEMTSIYNKWSEKSSSHAVATDEWLVMRSMVHVALDEKPLLLPPGSVRSLDRRLEREEVLQRRIDALEGELAAVRAQLAHTEQVSTNAHFALSELRASTSWKVSAPVRLAGAVAKKAREKRQS
ncbi:methyltransferase domain-containing protein [Umezawaea endophytica]|uniref:Methyltransferase domain-containing protein n=1 Tax=Umezawaea endophytica TaxID=1654476 RepID=A0A9X2VSM1_9PSEU|nr:methyltransferase domain-containing protein [Umezawaea endophytica]MCS7482118.1 methyltransferase domain-containing protein [Umezawaea endophytica]